MIKMSKLDWDFIGLYFEAHGLEGVFEEKGRKSARSNKATRKARQWIPNYQFDDPEIIALMMYIMDNYEDKAKKESIDQAVLDQDWMLRPMFIDRALVFNNYLPRPYGYIQSVTAEYSLTKEDDTLLEFLCKESVPVPFEYKYSAINIDSSLSFPYWTKGNVSIPAINKATRWLVERYMDTIFKFPKWREDVGQFIELQKELYRKGVANIFHRALRLQVDKYGKVREAILWNGKEVPSNKMIGKGYYGPELMKKFEASRLFYSHTHSYLEAEAARARHPLGIDFKGKPLSGIFGSLTHHVKHNSLPCWRSLDPKELPKELGFEDNTPPSKYIGASMDIKGMEKYTPHQFLVDINRRRDSYLPETIRFLELCNARADVYVPTTSYTDAKACGFWVHSRDQFTPSGVLSNQSYGTPSGGINTADTTQIEGGQIFGMAIRLSKCGLDPIRVMKGEYKCFKHKQDGDNISFNAWGDCYNAGKILIKYLASEPVILNYTVTFDPVIKQAGHNIRYVDGKYIAVPAPNNGFIKVLKPEYDFFMNIDGVKTCPAIGFWERNEFYAEKNEMFAEFLEVVNSGCRKILNKSLKELVPITDEEQNTYQRLVSKVPPKVLDLVRSGLMTGRKNYDIKTQILLVALGLLSGRYYALTDTAVSDIIAGRVPKDDIIPFEEVASKALEQLGLPGATEEATKQIILEGKNIEPSLLKPNIPETLAEQPSTELGEKYEISEIFSRL